MTRKRKKGHASLEKVDVPFGPNLRRQLVPLFVEAGNLHNKHRKQKAGNRTKNGRLHKASNSPTRTTYKGTDRMETATKAAPQAHFEGYSRLIESRPGFTGPQRQPIPEPKREPRRKSKRGRKKKKTLKRVVNVGPATHTANRGIYSPSQLRRMGF